MLIILVFLYFYLFLQLPRCLRAIFSSVWPHFLELFQNSFIFHHGEHGEVFGAHVAVFCDSWLKVGFFDRIEAERRKTALSSP
jgi:hypothetical protein